MKFETLYVIDIDQKLIDKHLSENRSKKVSRYANLGGKIIAAAIAKQTGVMLREITPGRFFIRLGVNQLPYTLDSKGLDFVRRFENAKLPDPCQIVLRKL